jgi:hypothetical protein
VTDLHPVEPAASFGPGLSLVWAILFGSAITVLFVLALWRFLVFRGRALRAESIEKSRQELEQGPALLCGRVETEDGGPAVRVEIDQVGTERSHKGQWSHEWRERNRVVHVRPFRLHVPGEEAVQVVPDERIRLVDTLETEKFEDNYRRRVAALENKEQVWISGVLAREGQKSGPATAYRSGPGSWVLRGTRLEPLEVASGSLGRQFSYWQRFHRKATIGLGAVFVLVNVFLLGPYHALLFLGEVERVTITDTSTYTTSSKGHRHTHYVVHGKLSRKAGGGSVEDEVDFSLYLDAKERGLKTVPFVYVPSATWIHGIGTAPRLSHLRAIFTFLGVGLSALLFGLARRGAMPWYEQGHVIERGQGTLASKAWDAQEPGRPGLYVPGRERAPSPRRE